MTFWDNVWAQFLGDLMAGAVILPFALWAEAHADEALRMRQNRRTDRTRGPHA